MSSAMFAEAAALLDAAAPQSSNLVITDAANDTITLIGTSKTTPAPNSAADIRIV